MHMQMDKAGHAKLSAIRKLEATVGGVAAADEAIMLFIPRSAGAPDLQGPALRSGVAPSSSLQQQKNGRNHPDWLTERQ